MNKNDIISIIETLESGKQPELNARMIPAFSEEACRGNDHISPEYLDCIAQSLTKEDIATFKRALKAIQDEELAWLGFKIVYDAKAAQENVDNEVTKKYGDQGSASGNPLVFFCNDNKEIVCKEQPSARDLFQMKDVTRGPSMHNEQFEGLTWVSVALFQPIRVWLLGASDVACALAPLCQKVGFDVTVVDYDRAYLNEKRFPSSQRILLEGGSFDGLAQIEADAKDFVCVLTRGHMHDPESCIWAASHNAAYIGMMGCAGKNDTVYNLVRNSGVTQEQWDKIKRPIGLKFGAKTPMELAIAIVAELIDARYRKRYSEEARQKHDLSLGR